MRLLVDSHVALWWLEGNDKLGVEARRLLESADEVFFSAATVWELGIKQALGKLDFPDGLADALVAGGFKELPSSAAHGAAAARLPPLHNDPFDRLLIAQARTEALVLMTADRAMEPYDVDSLDARV
ncbi:MAG TPA: type II toxin-antitoxin system VapC family toxin [Ilumatobacteraceae bacterium]|nr:type II toxin-antitoxin system VapC family toxin [Ilumatobacteraceae bacterium]